MAFIYQWPRRARFTQFVTILSSQVISNTPLAVISMLVNGQLLADKFGSINRMVVSSIIAKNTISNESNLWFNEIIEYIIIRISLVMMTMVLLHRWARSRDYWFNMETRYLADMLRIDCSIWWVYRLQLPILVSATHARLLWMALVMSIHHWAATDETNDSRFSLLLRPVGANTRCPIK